MNSEIHSILASCLNQNEDKAYQYFAWVPTIGNLSFREFNPSYLRSSQIHQCHYARFPSPINTKDSLRTLKRFSSFSFINLRGNKSQKLSTGDFRVYLCAEESEDKASVKGEVIFSSSSDSGSKEEKSFLKETKEWTLIEHNLELAQINKGRIMSLGQGGGYAENYKKIKELNTIWNNLKADFSVFKDSVKTHNENGWALLSYQFQLFRNGFLFFKESEHNEKALEEKPDNMPDYLYTTRDKKMMYYYIKQAFHTDAFHSNKIDSMIGVCNLKRLRLQTNPEMTAFIALKEVLYNHQKRYLTQALEDINRRKNLSSDPRGIAVYLEAYREKCHCLFSQTDNTFWLKEKNVLKGYKESAELIVKENAIPTQASSLFLYFLPILLLASGFYSATNTLFCWSDYIYEYFAFFICFAFIVRAAILRQLNKRVINISPSSHRRFLLLKSFSSMKMENWTKKERAFPWHIRVRLWWMNQTLTWQWQAKKAVAIAFLLATLILLVYQPPIILEATSINHGWCKKEVTN